MFHVRGLGPALKPLSQTEDLELKGPGVLGKGARILRPCVMGAQGRMGESLGEEQESRTWGSL